jgi:hypothetical protein
MLKGYKREISPTYRVQGTIQERDSLKSTRPQGCLDDSSRINF